MIAPDTLLQNRYLVQKQIGEGGMGAVYMATDQRFGSTVALKETFFNDPNLLKAFEREARLLNHLRHPALPRVSDHFTEEDGQFLVMEFIPGADLSEMLKERGAPFPASDVLDWADQLLDALDYLHTHEPPVIHRDIKPQNLKLTARKHIVLLDFGLAKGTPLQASRVTATGSLFGYSFNYAPLEQMQGAGTDPRSDLYSLGATLYHLLTNVTPPDALTRATAMVNGEPDPLRPANEIHAQVSASVAEVLMKAMAQSAAKRPQTAAEMRHALHEARKQTGSANAPTVIQPAPGINLHEQDTQLIKSGTGAVASEAATSIKEAGTAVSLHEAATVIQPPPSSSNPSPLNTQSRDGESVITKVRQEERASASSGWLSGRVLGILMSAVLLAVIAGVVYTFTRKPATQSPVVPTTTTTTAPASDPATPEPTAPAAVETESPASPPESQPTTTKKADTPPIKIIIRKDNKGGAKSDGHDEDNDPDSPPVPPGVFDKKDTPGLSPADRERIADEIQRAKQAARDADLQRREALRLQREQRRERLRQQRRREPPVPPY